MYNINAITYLLNSYNQMTNNFGQKSETVKVFREQVLGLAKMGTATKEDIDLVFSIIGMTNTDAVKFDIAKQNIDSFTLAMSTMEKSQRDKKKQLKALKELKEKKCISQKIYDIVVTIYDLDISNSSVSFFQVSRQAWVAFVDACVKYGDREINNVYFSIGNNKNSDRSRVWSSISALTEHEKMDFVKKLEKDPFNVCVVVKELADSSRCYMKNESFVFVKNEKLTIMLHNLLKDFAKK